MIRMNRYSTGADRMARFAEEYRQAVNASTSVEELDEVVERAVKMAPLGAAESRIREVAEPRRAELSVRRGVPLIERCRAFRAGVEPGRPVPPSSLVRDLMDDVIAALEVSKVSKNTGRDQGAAGIPSPGVRE